MRRACGWWRRPRAEGRREARRARGPRRRQGKPITRRRASEISFCERRRSRCAREGLERDLIVRFLFCSGGARCLPGARILEQVRRKLVGRPCTTVGECQQESPGEVTGRKAASSLPAARRSEARWGHIEGQWRGRRAFPEGRSWRRAPTNDQGREGVRRMVVQHHYCGGI